MKTNKDDSPLYVFDSNYDEHPVAKELLGDYEKPVYFRDDLFRFAPGVVLCSCSAASACSHAD
jgi:histone arginine demethylase JMJD6